LFFAHPELVAIYRQKNSVIMLNCRYKTNIFKLPLLCIYFIDSSGVVLPLAHVRMHDEKEEIYAWAFRCLAEMFVEQHADEPLVFIHDRDLALMHTFAEAFPGRAHMLCAWHIKIRVEATVQDQLGRERNELGTTRVASAAATEFMEYFYRCVNAPSEEAYDAACQELLVRARRDDSSATEQHHGEDLIAQPDQLILGNNDDSAAWLGLIRYLKRY
jgi:hypothetical protein